MDIFSVPRLISQATHTMTVGPATSEILELHVGAGGHALILLSTETAHAFKVDVAHDTEDGAYGCYDWTMDNTGAANYARFGVDIPAEILRVRVTNNGAASADYQVTVRVHPNPTGNSTAGSPVTA